MAGKQTRNTKKSVDKQENVFEKIATWIFAGWLILIFKIIAFIFWRNKYAKRYWDKKKEWWKTKRKLCSKALNEIIVSTILPKLKEYGFEPRPKACWGWCSMIHRYNYEAARLEGNELRYFEIYSNSRDKQLQIYTNIFILDPIIPKTVSEIGEYTTYLVYDFRKRNKNTTRSLLPLKKFQITKTTC